MSEADLTRALEEQKSHYRPLGLMLLDLGAVEDEYLAEAFAERGETYASMFDPFRIDRPVLDLLTPQEAATYGAVPLRRTNGSVDIALAEPLPTPQRIELERILGRRGVKNARFLFAPLSDIAFAVRFAWEPEAFAQVRDQTARLRASGVMDASQEAMLWRSVRAGYARLGDLLVREGALSHADLQSALAASRARGKPLAETLIDMGLAPRERVEAALKTQKSAAWVNQALLDALKSPAAAEPEPAPHV